MHGMKIKKFLLPLYMQEEQFHVMFIFFNPPTAVAFSHFWLLTQNCHDPDIRKDAVGN
jgi:hypothetical protein